MEEAKQIMEAAPSEDSNVFALFDPRTTRTPQKRATDEELADFRKYWPLMKQMLAEFEALKAQRGGCPIMRETLGLP